MDEVDDRLIDEIYEAAVVPELWSSVLENVARASASIAGGIIALDVDLHPRMISTETYRPTYDAFARGETRRYDNVRARRAQARRHQGFLRDVDLCTVEELAVDPLYRHCLHPYGLGWTAGTILPIATGDCIIFDFARRSPDGPHDRAHVATLDAYRPHLARAALLAARLGLERARSMAQAMDAIGVPAGVFASDGRLIAANPDWEGLWPRIEPVLRRRQADGGVDRPDMLRSLPIAATETLPPFIVHALPIRRSALDIFSGAGHIMIVTPVAMPSAPPIDVVAGLFDLSPAEARVAHALADGHSIDGCAAAFGVSTETVRKQVRNIMSKTETNRQVDLVRLLLGTASVSLPR